MLVQLITQLADKQTDGLIQFKGGFCTLQRKEYKLHCKYEILDSKRNLRAIPEYSLVFQVYHECVLKTEKKGKRTGIDENL